MSKLSKEDIQKIVNKWTHVINSPPSKCNNVMLIEPQEKIHTIDKFGRSISDEVYDHYDNNFKHDSDNNPEAYINVLVKNKMKKNMERRNKVNKI